MKKLKHHRAIWQRKKLLRSIYYQWYRKISQDLIPGKTLEIGSGIGNFKDFKPKVISSDIIKAKWLDMSFDAHQIPFAKNSIANIVLIDVLHHLENPIKFFDQAYRVLKPGGHLIMLEPFPSPVSLLVYRLFHPEPFYLKANPFKSKPLKIPNQAMAYLFFYKHLNRFLSRFRKKLKIIKKQKLSFILYPLSGGFENQQLIPDFSFPIFSLLEKILYPFKSLLAFRCYTVLEKL